MAEEKLVWNPTAHLTNDWRTLCEEYSVKVLRRTREGKMLWAGRWLTAEGSLYLAENLPTKAEAQEACQIHKNQRGRRRAWDERHP